MTEPVVGDWVSDSARAYLEEAHESLRGMDLDRLDSEIRRNIKANERLYFHDAINLNPATNMMNPRAEAALAAGLGSRVSLGHPGDKYEVGLDAVQKIEVIAARLACQVFGADFAEIRVGSGAMGNLYCFMATCQPGDTIIVPPASIGGHVTHNTDGAAGLYGLNIVEAPVDRDRYTIDVAGLAELAAEVKPKLITVGSSLNLMPHPVTEIREVADGVGAKVLFDAAHQCGMIAGKAWQQPLEDGAHVMSFSTYKSLGGPPAGLVVTNDASIAERVDAIAYPGLTANFDAANSAALAITLLDWIEFGGDYASTMAATAIALAEALASRGVPVFETEGGYTQSHQFAVEAAKYGGGQTAAKHIAKANLLTCGIGLPIDEVEGDMNGLRFGTPEIVRFGMKPDHMDRLADLIHAALVSDTPETLAEDVATLRQQFTELHFIRN